LKIDKSFVLNMAADENDAVIVRSTVDLGHNLGLEVVAEGVEDEVTLAYLDRCGIDYAQGYFIGQPMTAEDVTSRLRAARATPERGRAPHETGQRGRLAGHAAG
jgi:EAL domain-containing protein (putative c-di-GMP-specific phosphodiesterase class I)